MDKNPIAKVTHRHFYPTRKRRHASGQALVEYALIGVILVVALFAAVTLAGPAIGNVFSNTVYNALGRTTTPYSTFSAANYDDMATRLASHTPATFPFATNTPAAPTCRPGVWQTSVSTGYPPTYVLSC